MARKSEFLHRYRQLCLWPGTMSLRSIATLAKLPALPAWFADSAQLTFQTALCGSTAKEPSRAGGRKVLLPSSQPRSRARASRAALSLLGEAYQSRCTKASMPARRSGLVGQTAALFGRQCREGATAQLSASPQRSPLYRDPDRMPPRFDGVMRLLAHSSVTAKVIPLKRSASRHRDHCRGSATRIVPITSQQSRQCQHDCELWTRLNRLYSVKWRSGSIHIVIMELLESLPSW